MSWQVYSAVAVLLLSVAILLQRVILHRYKADDVAFAGMFQLSVATVMLPWVFANGISFAGYSSQWFAVGLCTACFGVGSVVYAKTLKHIDASAFSVLFATQAIWIILAGIWLYNERLSWLQLAGGILVFGSIVLLSESRQVFRRRKGVVYGLITGFLFGIAIASSAYVVRNVEPITWIWFSFVLGGIGSLMVQPSKIPLCKNLIRGKVLRLLIILAVIYALGNAAMNYAYLYGPFSLVAPIRQAGIIVTALLAFAFMRSERTNIARKLTAASICTIGVILLVI